MVFKIKFNKLKKFHKIIKRHVERAKDNEKIIYNEGNKLNEALQKEEEHIEAISELITEELKEIGKKAYDENFENIVVDLAGLIVDLMDLSTLIPNQYKERVKEFIKKINMIKNKFNSENNRTNLELYIKEMNQAMQEIIKPLSLKDQEMKKIKREFSTITDELEKVA